jgi:hypothetical protein
MNLSNFKNVHGQVFNSIVERSEFNDDELTIDRDEEIRSPKKRLNGCLTQMPHF